MLDYHEFDNTTRWLLVGFWTVFILIAICVPFSPGKFEPKSSERIYLQNITDKDRIRQIAREINELQQWEQEQKEKFLRRR